MNNFSARVCPKHCTGRAYTKTLFAIYLKFKLTCVPGVYSLNPAALRVALMPGKGKLAGGSLARVAREVGSERNQARQAESSLSDPHPQRPFLIVQLGTADRPDQGTERQWRGHSSWGLVTDGCCSSPGGCAVQAVVTYLWRHFEEHRQSPARKLPCAPRTEAGHGSQCGTDGHEVGTQEGAPFSTGLGPLRWGHPGVRAEGGGLGRTQTRNLTFLPAHRPLQVKAGFQIPTLGEMVFSITALRNGSIFISLGGIS